MFLRNAFDAFDMIGQKSPIHQPTDQDVLCGKDKSFNRHAGNIAFRSVIESYKSKYMSANTKQEKMRITKEVVSTMKSKYNARFVKMQGDEWEEISDQVARDKVSHALRFAASKQSYQTSITPFHLPSTVSTSSSSTESSVDALFRRQQELLSHQINLQAPVAMDCNDDGDAEPENSIHTIRESQQNNEEEDAFDTLRSEDLETILGQADISETEWKVVMNLAEF